MADQSILQRLAAALIGNPTGGAINGAAQAINNRAYQLHVAEARSLGEQPLTPQQFAAQQQQQTARQPQQAAPAQETKPFQFYGSMYFTNP